tara:strand:- start:516 stop:944 length:429 start_codon:yes stop_codon:yes gene_type:complete
MAVYDAQLNNNSERNARQYTDLDLFFGKRASDNDVGTITNVQAVKRSIRNLVQLDQFEKPFHPEIASNVRGMLFELMTPITSLMIARMVEDVITNFEPRAILQAVTALPDYDRNAYEIKVEFYVINRPTELVDMSVLLERLR